MFIESVWMTNDMIDPKKEKKKRKSARILSPKIVYYQMCKNRKNISYFLVVKSNIKMTTTQ